MVNTPILCKIKEIIPENKLVKTFWLEVLKKKNPFSKPEPGNYVMVWLPEPAINYNKLNNHTFKVVDQIPMSISDFHRGKIAITVKNVGLTTNELHQYKTGRYIGIIGPKGNSFNIIGKKLLVIGGGMGIAPLHFLVKTVKRKKLEVHSLIGVKSSEELILMDDIEKYSDSLHITTEDGSKGSACVVTDKMESLCNEIHPDQIFCCGPEKMMRIVLKFAISMNIPAQFSLERYMHCGIGICGFCSIGNLIICRDGPIFDSDILAKIDEFGKNRRDISGCLEPI